VNGSTNIYAACLDCPEEKPRSFTMIVGFDEADRVGAERGDWMAGHARVTGHRRFYISEFSEAVAELTEIEGGA
jgi:hypothetical protein